MAESMLRTIYGAVSVLLVEAAFWIVPPNHDPQFMALPWKIQASTIAMSVLLGCAGSILFVRSCLGKD